MCIRDRFNVSQMSAFENILNSLRGKRKIIHEMLARYKSKVLTMKISYFLRKNLDIASLTNPGNTRFNILNARVSVDK